MQSWQNEWLHDFEMTGSVKISWQIGQKRDGEGVDTTMDIEKGKIDEICKFFYFWKRVYPFFIERNKYRVLVLCTYCASLSFENNPKYKGYKGEKSGWQILSVTFFYLFCLNIFYTFFYSNYFYLFYSILFYSIRKKINIKKIHLFIKKLNSIGIKHPHKQWHAISAVLIKPSRSLLIISSLWPIFVPGVVSAGDDGWPSLVSAGSILSLVSGWGACWGAGWILIADTEAGELTVADV
jgi:hypothetical protein